MDNTIPSYRPDVVSVQTAPRPTPTPARVPFSEVLATGAQALARGAQAAVNVLPGAPLAAVALRGGGGSSTLGFALNGGPSLVSAASVGAAPEGPGGASAASTGLGTAAAGSMTSGATDPSNASIESSMAQSQQMNLYYLQVQEQVNAQNRTFTALSNVLEVEHSTAKSAIGNIH
jgi:hypothetical protein